jgi:hypothetical protein
MNRWRVVQWFLVALLAAFSHGLQAKERADTAMLHRVFHYFSTIDTTATDTMETYSYTHFRLTTDKRNFTLMLVPTMYVVAHGNMRDYVGEAYYRFLNTGYHTVGEEQLLQVSTIPHHRRAMETVISYLTPHIYETTMVDNYLLSPFVKANSKFYKYRVSFLLNGSARIEYKPKRDNTQLVSGEAIVDYYTGQVIRCKFNGEYDLLNFTIELNMGPSGVESLHPATVDVQCRFRFVGNKVRSHFFARFGLTRPIDDSLEGLTDEQKMDILRTDSLPEEDKMVFAKWRREQARKDSIKRAEERMQPEKKKKFNFFDFVGDNMLDRIKSHFGQNNQGYIRVNPILNPLYMGYDHRRGFTYKFDVRGSYQFSPISELTARFKAGYSFKQHQFYYRIPIYYYFNSRRNGYVRLEVGNGNHIKNNSVRHEIEQIFPDSMGMDFDKLNEFRYSDARLGVNYDLSKYFSLELGLLYQKRTAINTLVFNDLGWTTHYRSFAPTVELQVRPWGWKGPIITLDYDRGIKGVARSNMGYERWEFNGEYIHKLDRLQSFQMRVGVGFYTKDPEHKYFLNYENFKENNIPGGWNDEWSGEFELLNSDTYNYSEYYVRANLTYESPLLLLSWLPWLGHYMEMERIYVSTLDVKHIHPYTELGYGFTTRLFSMGTFIAFRKGEFDGVGCKFGFELFRKW